jgi:extracellular elastinolytic metalloproteinase
MRSVRPARSLALVVTAVAVALGLASSSEGSLERGSAATPAETALAYLRANAAVYSLTVDDLADVAVSDVYRSEHTGVTHVYLQQRHRATEVFNALATVAIARDGTVAHVASRFVGNLAPGAAGSPVLAEAAAVGAAAAALDLAPGSFRVAATRLVYQPLESGPVRLAWNVELDETSQQHWWSVRVDAETGELLSKHDLVAREAADGSSYRVFPVPVESPSHGPRALVANPARAPASPFGWHDTNGLAGPEFTVTRGNNAHAYGDTVGDGLPDPLSEPNGGPGLDFDFGFDPDGQPTDYRPFAVTNLFHWNNVIHDVFYGYGFTEAAGNFQVNNYGRGGLGNDDVRAEAQDGGGVNNANFLTPVDGSRPRMQMFLWTPPQQNEVEVNAPSPIAGKYTATGAQFGAPVTPAGVSGDVALVNDGTAPSTDACQSLVGFPAGRIALLDRGNCSFTQKVRNAQDAGAIAVIVANNIPGSPPITMGFGVGDPLVATIVIPSVMVGYDDGQTFRANLPFNATLRSRTGTQPLRDGDLDSGVIVHEYGHGISNRLTGGPSRVNCLGNQEQMGEGWSDWFAVALTARPGDVPTTRRGVGTYVLYQPPDSFGIRPAPYTTDMTTNPATYDTIKTSAVPHGVGYVWASIVWEVYWNLVLKHGFNPDIYGSWTTGGNNLAVQLVVDGLKLQPCSPGFVDGRNAILAADELLTGSDNYCDIWKGFAKRGLGFSAVQGSSGSITDGTQAFDLPGRCAAGILVDPPSLRAEQPANTRTTQTLRIQNGSLGGGSDLTWSVTECSDVSWLSVSPTSGTTAPGERSNVTVTFDSDGLAPPAKRTASLCVSSNDPDTPLVEVPVELQVIYAFAGFFGSVKNPPAVNRQNAGSIVPLLFSLSGDHGLDVFAEGSPYSVQVDCATLEPAGSSEPTLSSSGLSYDAAADRYKYEWTTQGDWAGSCRQLVLGLDDGTTHTAYFRFR